MGNRAESQELTAPHQRNGADCTSGTLVRKVCWTVSRILAKSLIKMRAGIRRERYQMEKKRAHGVCSLETQGENIRPAIPGGYWENTPEENAIRSACMEKLRESLARLPEQDARLSGCSFLRK